MSFLLLRAQPSLAALSTTRSPAIRLFTTVHASQKSAPDTVKDTLKSVDRAVSDAAVTGIDKGKEAAAKAREVAGIRGSEAKGKTEELTGEAKGKAEELTGEAKGMKHEAEGKIKSTAEEIKGKM